MNGNINIFYGVDKINSVCRTILSPTEARKKGRALISTLIQKLLNEFMGAKAAGNGYKCRQ